MQLYPALFFSSRARGRTWTSPVCLVVSALSLAVSLAACSVEVAGSGLLVGAEDRPPDAGAPTGALDAGASIGEPTDASPDVRGDASGDASAHSDACDVDGRYAIRVAFDVKWAGTSFAGLIPIIGAGEGELSFIVLVDIARGVDQTRALARACAAEVPDFVSTLPRELYSARFAHGIWESQDMPRFELAMHYDCFEASCAVRADPIFAKLGAELASPSSVWPMRAAGGVWPDHDRDGSPGITLQMRGPDEQDAQGRSYAYPPVNPVLIRRVKEVMLGIRIGLTLDGTMESCDGLSGTAPEGSIETRAIDCVAASGPSSCSDDELTFLDDNLPIWAVSGGTFRGIRVADDADCAAVRAAFP